MLTEKRLTSRTGTRPVRVWCLRVANAWSVRWRPLWAVALVLSLAWSVNVVGVAADGDKLGPTPEIDRSIRRALAYIKANANKTNGSTGQFFLAALALSKSGEPAEAPIVKDAIAQIRSMCQYGIYKPANGHTQIYEAGVACMLMGSADARAYRPEIEAIAKFLMEKQHKGGAWDYEGREEKGDTSITQYGILGLWEAVRAGVDVPKDVWQRAAGWHIRTQARDGGFTYHPDEAAESTLRTMTVAGTGSLLICKRMLFSADVSDPAEPDPAPGAAAGPSIGSASNSSSKKKFRFGVVEQGPLEPPPPPAPPGGGGAAPAVTLATLNSRIDGGMRWIEKSYTTDRLEIGALTWRTYYFYGIERLAALSGKNRIGDHDWYNEIAGLLGQMQQAEGDWQDSATPLGATSLGVLFLVRATAKVVQPIKKSPLFGAGILVGGRGLPEDLNEAQVGANGVKSKKVKTPVEQLLAQLENPAALDVATEQEDLVEQISTEQVRGLIGQKDRLIKLARDKRTEVRRTAFWALGRSNDFSVVPLLIKGLLDPEAECVVEARNALQALTRRPVLQPPNDNPTDAEKRAAYTAWSEWYAKVKSYEERDALETGKP
jgi:hypothetical protein